MMRKAGKFCINMGSRSLSGVIGALWSAQLAESLCFVISSMYALMLS